MKKIVITLLSLSTISFAQAQYNTVWTHTTLNTGVSGYVGIGTKNNSGTTNTPAPAFNLHLHGTSDYIVTNAQSGIMQIDSTHGILSAHPFSSNSYKSSINYGKTTRIGLTNSTTGLLESDGAVLQMSGNNFTISNRENGVLSINALGTGITLSGVNGRTWFGSQASSNQTSTTYAETNILSTENGLYIENLVAAKYGLSLKMHSEQDLAIQVMGYGGSTTTVRNFAVKANGEVFARKYTTTLSAIPDYVFEPNYPLMSLSELRNYVQTNKHLPNIPSAKEYEQTGVDLGELNRLLLEKTEELTLYILQLEERLKALESSK